MNLESEYSMGDWVKPKGHAMSDEKREPDPIRQAAEELAKTILDTWDLDGWDPMVHKIESALRREVERERERIEKMGCPHGCSDGNCPFDRMMRRIRYENGTRKLPRAAGASCVVGSPHIGTGLGRLRSCFTRPHAYDLIDWRREHLAINHDSGPRRREDRLGGFLHFVIIHHCQHHDLRREGDVVFATTPLLRLRAGACTRDP